MAATKQNGFQVGSLPLTRHSAVGRLNDVKSHQWSLGQEIRHNWRGWLGSFVFHTGIIVVLMTITWTIIHEEPVRILTLSQMPTLPKPQKEPLPFFDDRLPVESDVLGPPSFDTDGDKPSRGYPGLDMEGVPPWIGRGPLRDGHDPGGPPGLPPGLPPILKQYRKLDVVFVFDSTGSMGGILLEVKTRIRQFVQVVTYLVPNTRLGLVTYRDNKKYDLDEYQYTVKYMPLTKADEAGMEKIQRFLRQTEAYGGGDIPEAVYEGLRTAIHSAGWRKDAKKVIILFGDAPPRPEDDGLARIYKLCRNWHTKTGGVISCIDTTGASKLLEEFQQMAAGGGGQSCFLNDERAIIKQLVLYIFPKEAAPPVEEFWNNVVRDGGDTILKK